VYFTLEDVLAALARAAANQTPPRVLVRVRALPAPVVTLRVRGDEITEPFAQVSDPG
jgi:hypothetical protein